MARRRLVGLLPPSARWAIVRYRWPASLRHSVGAWRAEQVRQQRDAPANHFDMIAAHVADSFAGYMAIPLFSIPLLLQARNIVELGSAFSYYPDTYPGGSPWVASKSGSEGNAGTRFLLSSARLLNHAGVPARVTSIDIRSADDPKMAGSRSLLSSLGLMEFWNPVMGQDTVAWLRGWDERIDFALVDSNHTYAHVAAELAALEPLMSERSVIAVDNAYTYYYANPLELLQGTAASGDDEVGIRRGGKFGAIREFTAAHPEWQPVWTRSDLMFLCRGITL